MEALIQDLKLKQKDLLRQKTLCTLFLELQLSKGENEKDQFLSELKKIRKASSKFEKKFVIFSLNKPEKLTSNF